MMQPTESALSELLEQVNFTLSQKFVEKWKYVYPNKLIVYFQYKLLHAFQVEKPIKRATLSSQLAKKGRVTEEVVKAFLEDVDLFLYYPIIS